MQLVSTAFVANEDGKTTLETSEEDVDKTTFEASEKDVDKTLLKPRCGFFH